MNKKVLTLCAGLLLAGSATAWGQVVIDKGLAAGDNAYEVQSSSYAALTQYVQENASNRGNMNFPTVSPFAIQTKYGAKPITELQHVDGQSDGRYFQLVVGEIAGKDAEKDKNTGTDVLTMVWVNQSGELGPNQNSDPNAKNLGAGHYEIQIENVHNANVPNNRITLDRTLWKVTANKLNGTNTLVYQLQNKASKVLLQLSRENVVNHAGATAAQDGTPIEAQEVLLNITSGQPSWQWAEAQKAPSTSTSAIESGLTVLRNNLTAQYDDNTEIHLAIKEVKSGGTTVSKTLGAIKMNSSINFVESDDVVTISYNVGFTSYTETYTPVKFEGWEANPIILTAAQINAELGNEDEAATDAEKTKDYFHFEFDNDVQGDVNVMTASDFVAEAAKNEATYGAYNRLPGDAPDYYVRFMKKGSDGEYLRVDTAYYDASANDQYALKMTVDKVLYPREAVLADGLRVNSDGALTYANGQVLTNTQIYTTADANNTAKAYVQLKRQTNFRPIFYPSTQSLRLQAEMMYRADKTSDKPWWQQMVDKPWWQQMVEDVVSNEMQPAAYAENPDLSKAPENMKGYYPSYSQIINPNGTGSKDQYKQGYRLIHYAQAWKATDLTSAAARNGYAPHGANDADEMLWNAVGNVLLGRVDAGAVEYTDATNNVWSNLSGNPVNVFVYDPAAKTKTGKYLAHLMGAATGESANPNEVKPATVGACVIPTPEFALAHSNLVSIRTLTTGHRVLTTDVHDWNDKEYNGLNTYITLKEVKTESGLEEVAEIQEGFYYIINANKKNADLVKVGDYRYEDLAATNAMFSYWNSNTQKWDRASSGLDDANPSAPGLNVDRHKADKANVGNLVYSEDKKVIPSAQWYIKGSEGVYTIINRESGRPWGTSLWWKTDEPGVYVNLATYTDGSSLQEPFMWDIYKQHDYTISIYLYTRRFEFVKLASKDFEAWENCMPWFNSKLQYYTDVFKIDTYNTHLIRRELYEKSDYRRYDIPFFAFTGKAVAADGTIYWLDHTNKTGFSIHGDYLLNTYGIRNYLERLPSVELTDMSALAGYDIIAL